MISYASFIFLSLCLFHNVESSARIDPLVDTKVGLIRGLRSSNGQYSMFMGIPFGQVNASNPFGIATEYPHFGKPYDAYDDTSLCPQTNKTNQFAIGSLDCLRLNIYVPAVATSTFKLPVMIWIYGGAFLRGSSSRASAGPDYLVRHDVILVTINYRVGPYGFMCLDIPEVPGNQGLKDQYLAIKWVKENIAAFGGDVNKITLFGESAGGHSIDLHLRSSYEKLFNNAIMQSGSAVAATVFQEPDKEAPIKLAEHLGLNTTCIHEALEFLAGTEPEQIIEATVALDISFKPCVEKDIDGVDNFITTTWVDTAVPKVANMPVLLGFNNHEFLTIYANNGVDHYKESNIFQNSLQSQFKFSEDELVEMSNLFRHFYMGDRPITEELEWPIVDFGSDYTYIHPIRRTINKFMESGAGDLYYYMFSYSGGRNYAKIAANITEGGAAHADEMGYLFSMAALQDAPNAADQLVLDRMTTMWTNFAKYSDPTPEVTDLLPLKWTPVTADTLYCMEINSTLTLTGRPLHERMAFWELFLKMNKALLKKFDD
ncbi:acetylcholinesterase isoform X2 [Manduca sexta]|uniref:acetylcholinesterase isoform X2 n=1 Tax=Manduca sexta TaxID=7130 RepID=UPI00188F8378|nr:acetylcholinesterase isoform X2 [Manduca sexta]